MGGSEPVILQETFDDDYEPTDKEIHEYAVYLGMDVEIDSDLLWIAKDGLKKPVPEPWKPCRNTDNGEIYYFNFETGESSWDHPCDQECKKLYQEEKAKKRGRSSDGGQSRELEHITATRPKAPGRRARGSTPPPKQQEDWDAQDDDEPYNSDQEQDEGKAETATGDVEHLSPIEKHQEAIGRRLDQFSENITKTFSLMEEMEKRRQSVKKPTEDIAAASEAAPAPAGETSSSPEAKTSPNSEGPQVQDEDGKVSTSWLLEKIETDLSSQMQKLQNFNSPSNHLEKPVEQMTPMELRLQEILHTPPNQRSPELPPDASVKNEARPAVLSQILDGATAADKALGKSAALLSTIDDNEKGVSSPSRESLFFTARDLVRELSHLLATEQANRKAAESHARDCESVASKMTREARQLSERCRLLNLENALAVEELEKLRKEKYENEDVVVVDHGKRFDNEEFQPIGRKPWHPPGVTSKRRHVFKIGKSREESPQDEREEYEAPLSLQPGDRFLREREEEEQTEMAEAEAEAAQKMFNFPSSDLPSFDDFTRKKANGLKPGFQSVILSRSQQLNALRSHNHGNHTDGDLSGQGAYHANCYPTSQPGQRVVDKLRPKFVSYGQDDVDYELEEAENEEDMVRILVDRLVAKFEKQDVLLPLRQLKGTCYLLNSRRIHLFVVGKKLMVRMGGGAQPLLDFLQHAKLG